MTPAAATLTPMRVQGDSSPVRSHLAVNQLTVIRDSPLKGYTGMQSAPLPRTTEDAVLEQVPGPILWDPIFPAPRPSPRTRIVCVPGQSPKEEHDRTSETEYLERVITLLELSMERLVGSSRELVGNSRELQRRYDALQKKNNMLELEHVELKKKCHPDIANKDSEIAKLQEEILRLRSVNFQLKDR